MVGANKKDVNCMIWTCLYKDNEELQNHWRWSITTVIFLIFKSALSMVLVSSIPASERNPWNPLYTPLTMICLGQPFTSSSKKVCFELSDLALIWSNEFDPYGLCLFPVYVSSLTFVSPSWGVVPRHIELEKVNKLPRYSNVRTVWNN